MPTLLQILLKKAPVEFDFYNPLQAKIGDSIKVDDLDYESFDFKITGIRELKRELGGQTYMIADYDISGSNLSNESQSLKLRVMPNESGKHDVIIMSIASSFGHDADYQASLESGEDTLTWDDATYWRVNDSTDTWLAQTAYLSDVDGDGKMEASEVNKSEIKYWDYWRNTELHGVEVLEFVFIEMNNQDGFFHLWRGNHASLERLVLS